MENFIFCAVNKRFFRGVFRTQLVIYDGAFFTKIIKVF